VDDAVDQAPVTPDRSASSGGVDRSVGRRRVGRENLARILKAAEHVFAETGFGGATMAEIAEQAGLPKANLHYYFGTKEDLYRAVLDDILTVWLSPIAAVEPDADPAAALAAYVHAKMEATRSRPQASRVFANEVLHGAPQIERYLSEDLRRIVAEKSKVLDGWIAAGRMAPVDTKHFFFMIWALTQHYADFAVQVRLVLDKTRLDRKDWDHITAEVTRLVLRAAGLEQAAGSEHRAKGA
jgi:TetR/AcrR family transcriptional regulator